ncbi:MAG: ribose-phosphate pyrophosphokinase [Lachnospiraceae bacterium]|nr:ribose-phosphate pyrophosphokinase [Lachnospiraceae bacterium]
MIYSNSQKANIEFFPDGTVRIKNMTNVSQNKVTWQYENDVELFQIYSLVRHIQKKCKNENIELYIPYLPNARMDRVKSDDEVFTLKYFAEIINSLGLKNVSILDAHSNVSLGVIDNVKNIVPQKYIFDCLQKVKSQMNCDNLVIYFPDEGASKRYADLLQGYQTCFGIKKRDWATGEIKGLSVFGLDSADALRGKAVLMIDDICSYGGTFFYSSKALKELGAEEIYSYTTHTEQSIFDSDRGVYLKALETGMVKKHYTTNSIFNRESDYIEVIDCIMSRDNDYIMF